jgi:site-specific DNA recombinase
MRDRGDTEEDQAETDRLIRQLRQERSQVTAEIGVLEAANQRPIEVPSETAVREMLQHLGQILTAAARGKTEGDMSDAREIIMLLTGGRIELYQQGERRAKRGWLQGRFTVRLLDVLVQRSAGVTYRQDENGIEVVIDYRRPPRYLAEAERAKELYDKNLLKKEIAKQLGCSPAKVTKLLNYWFESHGQAEPNPHARALALGRGGPARYVQIKNEVKSLWDQNLSAVKIAKSLKTSTITVMRAITHWHRTRGLPVPTGRSRLQDRIRRVKELHDARRQVKEIAAELGLSRSGVRVLLRMACGRRE